MKLDEFARAFPGMGVPMLEQERLNARRQEQIVKWNSLSRFGKLKARLMWKLFREEP